MDDQMVEIASTAWGTTRAQRHAAEVAAYYQTLVARDVPEKLAETLTVDYADLVTGSALMAEYGADDEGAL